MSELTETEIIELAKKAELWSERAGVGMAWGGVLQLQDFVSEIVKRCAPQHPTPQLVDELLHRIHALMPTLACAGAQSERLRIAVDMGALIDNLALLVAQPAAIKNECCTRWRDDALEQAAIIADQYGSSVYVALDIRALKSSPIAQPTTRQILVEQDEGIEHVTLPPVAQSALTPQMVFAHIEHGDAEHRKWLLEKLVEVFSAQPAAVPSEQVKTIYCVGNKVAQMFFASKENADRVVANSSPAAGLIIMEIQMLDDHSPAVVGGEAVPEGYALVPIEPTYEMNLAGISIDDYPWDGLKPSRIYSAMIAAAQPDKGKDDL